jgi:hypothetical protein
MGSPTLTQAKTLGASAFGIRMHPWLAAYVGTSG